MHLFIRKATIYTNNVQHYHYMNRLTIWVINVKKRSGQIPIIRKKVDVALLMP